MEKKKRDRDGYGFQEVAHEEDPQGDGGGSGEGEADADGGVGGIDLVGELWIDFLFSSFSLLGLLGIMLSGFCLGARSNGFVIGNVCAIKIY